MDPWSTGFIIRFYHSVVCQVQKLIPNIVFNLEGRRHAYSVRLSYFLSACLSVCGSVYPSVCVSVFLSVCLSVCVFIRLFLCRQSGSENRKKAFALWHLDLQISLSIRLLSSAHILRFLFYSELSVCIHQIVLSVKIFVNHLEKYKK